jgi:hypothetical protein
MITKRVLPIASPPATPPKDSCINCSHAKGPTPLLSAKAHHDKHRFQIRTDLKPLIGAVIVNESVRNPVIKLLKEMRLPDDYLVFTCSKHVWWFGCGTRKNCDQIANLRTHLLNRNRHPPSVTSHFPAA